MLVCNLLLIFQCLPTQQPSQQSSYDATFSNNIKIDGDQLRGFVQTSEQKIYVTYTFQTAQEKTFYETQSLASRGVHIKGTWQAVEKPHHAYAFSMASYLKSHRAQGIFHIDEMTLSAMSHFSVASFLGEQRFRVQQQIERVFPESLIPEALALIIGNQQQVDEAQQRAYQTLGITHIFAISGLHVALLSLLLFEIMIRCGINRQIASFILIVFLPMYAVIAGGAPSVWRAVLTVVLIYALQLLRKVNLQLDDALAISFILFVLYEPFTIYQIGFQLSYLATAAIIFSMAQLSNVKSVIKKSFYVTFICQLLVSPLLLYHFYEVSISSLMMNFIFVPLFSYVILPINFVFYTLSYVMPNITTLCLNYYEICREALTQFILFCHTLPLQVWSPGKISNVTLIIAFSTIVFYFIATDLQKYRKEKWLLLLLLAAVIHFAPFWQPSFVITYLSVGQGDCTIIELPYKKRVYVIDTGGVLRFSQKEKWQQKKSTYEVGRDVVVPYLKGRGIKKIDTLVLTHADADHVEGAEEVLQEIKVKEIHVTPNATQKEIMKPLIAEAKKQQVPIREKMAHMGWQVDKAVFTYVYPFDTHYEGNNDSLVLKVQYEQFSTLLTGDIERSGEQQLINESRAQIKDITVLSAGHHGSKTSSSETFIQTTNPQLVLFSTAKNNRYGHPAQEVVERYEAANVRMWNTAEQRTLRIHVTRNKVEIANPK